MFKELNIRNRAELVNYVMEHDLMQTSAGSNVRTTRSVGARDEK